MTSLPTPRLVSYAPDGSTCTLNFDGEEYYYDCVGTTSTVDSMREKEIAMLREMLAKRDEQLAEAQTALEVSRQWAKTYELGLAAANVQLAEAQAQIETLKTTPPDKREDLHCVISDLCEQVRAREEQLEAVTNQRDEWVKTACKLPEVSAALKFAVEQGVKFQQQLAECQAALVLKDEALFYALQGE